MAKTRGNFLTTMYQAWVDYANGARGEPEPLGPDQRRTLGTVAPQTFHPSHRNIVTRRYDRGDKGLAFQASDELIQSNPIGAGVPFWNQLPILSDGPLLTYQRGSILWSPQQITHGQQPSGAPAYTPAQLKAMLGDYSSDAIVPTAGPVY